MALKDKATFTAAIEQAATAYQEAIGDDTLTGVALPLSNPHHPLRRVKKLIDLSDDGVFKEDVLYIAEAYSGKFPTKGAQDLDKKVNAPSAPSNIEREFLNSWDGFSEIGQGNAGTSGLNIAGADDRAIGGASETAIFDAWVAFGVGIIVFQQKTNPSNTFTVTSAWLTPGSGGYTNTYHFDSTGGSWSVGEPATGEIIIILPPS